MAILQLHFYGKLVFSTRITVGVGESMKKTDLFILLVVTMTL